MQDGRVLIVGGHGAGPNAEFTAEIYNPRTKICRATASLNLARLNAATYVLPSGKVLVAAGFGQSSEIFDPHSETWTLVPGNLTLSLDGNYIVPLLNGKALIVSRSASYLFTLDTDIQEAWRPQLTAAATSSGSPVLTLTGTGFRPPLTASSGNEITDSPTNYPIVRWTELSGGRNFILPMRPGTSFSDTQTTVSLPPAAGYGLVSVVVNGIPSNSLPMVMQVTKTGDFDNDGTPDLAEVLALGAGLDPFTPDESTAALIASVTGNGGWEYTQSEYDSHYGTGHDAGENAVTSDPNAYNLYTLNQVQALHPGAPLIQRNPTTGKFTLTLGLERTTGLTDDYVPFAFDVPGANTEIVDGKIEFEFSSGDDTAFFHLEVQ